ncbi:CRP-like cAMP-binding protein [Bosea sp. BE271]|uniref:Crp/Fnr family transcriptional regulator n=1 Tax=Bosea TaxID=85413 RepID=UPI002740B0F7|nr:MULTISPECIES: Crp/Fnr family transcriptional regulator [Bosea]MDR6827962.1 CRP-like cAMP-binding protein [Bosea robiniae]MDR6894888.1 CRP-like cAMP-binding protein [Bosea sp. BE109]MDR7138068.1 CRP-like cAMP-binding protein [Bosea sp. BE168]MDR7174767.1 CRP-like cAMP-binding protein [Bosea sp. BE271]
MQSQDAAELLISALSLHGSLSGGDETALRDTSFRLHRYARGSAIARAHTSPHESCFVISGLASREIIMPRGARAFVGMYIRGDFVDLHAFLLDSLDHDVVALTQVVMAFVSHTDIGRLIASQTINRLLWRFIAVDAAIQRYWLASMARRKASDRLAHFLCEQYIRMRAQGLVSADSFDLPLSQALLGDVIGLSAVHMNRSIQTLRRTGLLKWEGNTVTISFPRLAELCGFEPSYLNLQRLATSGGDGTCRA